jgi:predicted metal-dependent HD superfamily phosphohydrolase
MIRHVVTWKLKAEDAEGKSAAFTEMAEALGALPALLPVIKTFHLGADLGDTDGNWDATLIVDFANAADLEAYQVHPEHKKAAAVTRLHAADRATVDFEL